MTKPDYLKRTLNMFGITLQVNIMDKMQKLNRKMLKAWALHKVAKAKRIWWKMIKQSLKLHKEEENGK